MAAPGYGKRSAPGQCPRTNHDFGHLPAREAAIAAYLDRLPDGTDISVKTLARELPYGQCALRTALNRIQAAGHLRRGREHVRGTDGARWITRTWFSRTARDDTWWSAFTRGEVPEGHGQKESGAGEDRPEESDPVESGAKGRRPQGSWSTEGRGPGGIWSTEGRGPEESGPGRSRPPIRSRAYVLLAALGRTAPVLSLSYVDCLRLEPLVTQWFARGADEADVLRALTCGLPTPVHSPAALVRNRLTSKLPPQPLLRPALRLLECATCGTPGSPEALAGGVCGPCRGKPDPRRQGPLSPEAVRAHAAAARTAKATADHPRHRTPA
ncbi:hypothetical protein [Streptomyces sp. NPDC023327]|uniref:hypothetical protein n=1 Tax=Streptomyces sp. NPDC023327 TaxID=3157088 RepID=UPI003406B255